MNSNDKSTGTQITWAAEDRKPYLAPGFKRLSPAAAEELLLRKADTTDPDVRRLLARINETKGS